MSNYKVILDKLRIINFGPYYGENKTVKFSYGEKNITVFEGAIGSGKTSIFQLLYWIIFGDENRIETSSKHDHVELKFLKSKIFKDAINKIAINNELNGILTVGGIIDFIIIDNDNEEKISVRREKRATVKDGMIIDSLKENLEIFQNGEKIKPYEIKKIQRIINPAIREFIFIHGESFNYSLKDVTKTKSFAISLSKLPIIKEMPAIVKDMQETIRSKINKINKTDNTLSKLNDQIQELTDEIDEYNNKISEIDDNINNVQMDINEIEKNLKNLPENLDKIKQLDYKNSILNKKKEEYITMHNGFNELLEKELPFIYLSKAMKVCNTYVSNILKTKYRHLSFLSVELIDKILTMDSLFGVPWNDEIRNTVIQYKNNLNQNTKQVIIKKLSIYQQNLKSKINENQFRLDKIYTKYNKINKLKDEINILENEIEHLKSSLSNTNYESVSNDYKSLENKYRKLKEKLDFHKENKNGYIRARNKVEEELRKKQNSYSKYSQRINNEQTQVYTNNMNTLYKYEKIIREIIIKYEQNLKDIITENINEIFLKFVSNKDEWEKIKIDETVNGWKFSISKRLDGKSEEIANLSGGQTNLSSLSYAIALNKSVKSNLPIVYDSMFVNLSKPERLNVSKNISELYKGSQVILFLKDQELDGVSPEFFDYIGYHYKLELNSKNEGEILEVIK